MSEISAFLERRFACPDDRGRPFIERAERFWAAFKPYADHGFVPAFCTDDPAAFQQRYWELFLGATLLEQGLALRPNPGKGPDLSFDMAGRIVWIEAISPGPGDGNNRIPETHLQDPSEPLVVHEVPDREILLRHTAAIEEKVQKYRGYRQNGIVAETEPFIIALDCSQLGIFGFHGISGYPATLEAVFPAGPQQVHFVPGGPEQTTSDIQYRPAVANANQAQVATTRFLDETYSGISGVLSTSRSDAERIPEIPVIFVHNKLAKNPIRPLPIRVDTEYYLEDVPGGVRILKIP
jgi:hypothetical protein